MGTASLAHTGEVIRPTSEERVVYHRRNPVLHAALGSKAMSGQGVSRPMSFSAQIA
jgi:hypothetical protein